MQGLYERDYFILTKEEDAEYQKILQEEVIPGKPFHKSLYHLYPLAVRHNLSLFPNNFIDRIWAKNNKEILMKQYDEFEKIIEDKNTSELDVKRFIQDNRYYHIIASLLTDYPFGHHGIYVFKEFKLGAKYIADYLLIGESSDGCQFLFVEFENIYGKIVLADGSFGDTIRKGINQIHDWQQFLEYSYGSLADELTKCRKGELGQEFYRYDSTRMHYMVVAGRREDYTDKTRRLRRQEEKQGNIRIIHYDRLLEMARADIEENVY